MRAKPAAKPRAAGWAVGRTRVEGRDSQVDWRGEMAASSPRGEAAEGEEVEASRGEVAAMRDEEG